MDFTKGLSSSWTDLRSGLSAITEPAPIKLLAKRLAADVYDYYFGDEFNKRTAKLYLFDEEETNEDIFPFKFVCDTFGFNKKNLCNAIDRGLPKNIKTLSKMALQNDRKAIEMVTELRRLLVMKDNYKPPEKKQIKRQRRKKTNVTED